MNINEYKTEMTLKSYRQEDAYPNVFIGCLKFCSKLQ